MNSVPDPKPYGHFSQHKEARLKNEDGPLFLIKSVSGTGIFGGCYNAQALSEWSVIIKIRPLEPRPLDIADFDTGKAERSLQPDIDHFAITADPSFFTDRGGE